MFLAIESFAAGAGTGTRLAVCAGHQFAVAMLVFDGPQQSAEELLKRHLQARLDEARVRLEWQLAQKAPTKPLFGQNQKSKP